MTFDVTKRNNEWYKQKYTIYILVEDLNTLIKEYPAFLLKHYPYRYFGRDDDPEYGDGLEFLAIEEINKDVAVLV